jgi:hypothetical protein
VRGGCQNRRGWVAHVLGRGAAEQHHTELRNQIGAGAPWGCS